MVEKHRKLVLLGDSAFAEVAFEYFTYDSPYEVVGFSVEQAYVTRDSLFGLPVVPLEEIETVFTPETHDFFASVVYTQHNELRTRLYLETKARGYRPASYISRNNTFIWRNVQLGEHCFIFENNVLQPFVSVGDNVVLWSGNHIGHHSQIGDHTFVSSHVVVSGFCNIGQACFLGVNSTFADRVTVGNRCVVGASATILGDVPDDQVAVGLWRKRKMPQVVEE